MDDYNTDNLLNCDLIFLYEHVSIFVGILFVFWSVLSNPTVILTEAVIGAGTTLEVF